MAYQYTHLGTYDYNNSNYNTDDEEQGPPVIMDNGSGYMKAGFTGDDAPRAIFPTVVGRPRHRGVMVGMGRKDAYVGDESIAKRGILRIKHPIEYGTVTNWDDMEKIWHHSFYNELRVAPEEFKIFLTDKIPPPNSPKVNRMKMMQIMFETFNALGFYVECQSVLALYANGLATGVSIDFGYGITYSTPIHNGKIIKNAIQSTYIGSVDITNYLKQILSKKINTNDIDMHVINDIKHKCCFSKTFPNLSDKIKGQYIIYGYLRNRTKYDLLSSVNIISNDVVDLCHTFYDDEKVEMMYKLPDSNTIKLNKYERYQCVECLFNPLNNEIGIHQLCINSLNKCNDKYKKELSKNIVISGGTSLFNNIEYRLKTELKKKDQTSTYSFNVIKKKQTISTHEYTSWIGASILASLSSFEKEWITKEDYDINGPEKLVEKYFN